MKWRIDNRPRINPEAGVNIPFDGLEPRMRQVASSYAVLFAHDTAVLSDFLSFMKERQKELIEERASSPEGNIVNAIYEIQNEEKEEGLVERDREISSKDIEEHLKADGVEITHRVIGRHLRNLGIQTKFIYKSKNKAGKRNILWNDEHMATLFRRYVVGEWMKAISSISSLSSISRGGSPSSSTGNQRILNDVKGGDDDDDVAPHDSHDIHDINDIKKEEEVVELYQFDIVVWLMDAIREAEKVFGSASIRELVVAGKARGLSELDVVNTLDLLRRDGRIYQPKDGYVKVV